MNIASKLATLALQQVAESALATVGFKEAGGALVGFLVERFTDESGRLNAALEHANTQAWKCLEIALAGDSLWERCKSLAARGDDKAFAQSVRAFLDSAPLPELAGKKSDFRQKCLDELRAASKTESLRALTFDPKALAEQSVALARFDDPSKRAGAEWRGMADIAGDLRNANYPSLAWLLSQRPTHGDPLLVMAVRYFFRRAVERDENLFRSLATAKLENLGEAQERGFAAISAALDENSGRLEELLDDVKTIVIETHGAVLDLKEQVEGQSQQVQQIGAAVQKLLEQHQLGRREVRPGDSLSIRDEGERQLIKILVARYRELPSQDRHQVPALLNAIGKLEVITGEFESAQRDFQEVGELVAEPAVRAEACYNAYRAALEGRRWTDAQNALLQAAALHPGRFAPFPFAKFEPERILGAGGFGVAFLCRNRHSGSRVVIKTLNAETLDRSVGDIFREAQVLEELDHPAIIRVRDCDFADHEKQRPFVVMDYFPGETLEAFVSSNGPLAEESLRAIAAALAKGIQVAHERGILHRDIKPANILVRRNGKNLQVKLIDFGLALRNESMKNTVSSMRDKTLAGSSIAGTLDYAAPEQLGRVKGIAAGPYSDVYGFAKTCCYALFQTPQPTFHHWEKVTRPLAVLLGKCLEEDSQKRPQGFGVVLAELEKAPAMPAAADVVPMPAPRREKSQMPIAPEPQGRPRHRPARGAKPKRQSGGLLRWFGWLVVIGLVISCVGPALYLNYMKNDLKERVKATLESQENDLKAKVKAALDAQQNAAQPKNISDPAATVPNVLPRNDRPPTPDIAKVQPKVTVKPIPVGDEDWDEFLTSFKDASVEERVPLLDRLLVTPVKAASQKEIATALDPILLEGTQTAKERAALVVEKWGTELNAPTLMRIQKDAPAPLRANALFALAAAGDESAATFVIQRWRSNEFDGRLCARVLKAFGPIAQKPLEKEMDLTSDKRWLVEACKILGCIGTPEALLALQTPATDSDKSLREAAKDAVEAIKLRYDLHDFVNPEKTPLDEETETFLKSFKFAKVDDRPRMMDRLSKTPVSEAYRAEIAKAIDPLLRNGFFPARNQAANALQKWGTKDNVPSLVAVLEDRVMSIRASALVALRTIGDESAIAPIAKRVSDPWDREGVLAALKSFGPRAEKAIDEQLQSLTDNGRLISLCDLLATFGTTESFPALTVAVQNTNADVQVAATDARRVIEARKRWAEREN